MDSENKFYRSSSYNKEKEQAESIKLLYKFFCNSIRLGQWESARACVDQLQKEGHFLEHNIFEILKNVAGYPFTQSFGSKTVSSPAHLSWLCLLECDRLQTQYVFEDKYGTFADVDFRLLLYEECNQTDAVVIKELYQTFLQKHSSGSYHKSEHLLSKASLTFLKETLANNPTLGHALITSLMQAASESKNSENLQLLYLQCLEAILDRICKTTGNQTQSNNLCDDVYLLLGMYDPLPYWNYLPLRHLFSRLLELMKLNNSGLNEDKILSVIIGRKHTYLIEEFIKLETELMSRELNIKQDMKVKVGDLSEDQQNLVEIFHNPDPDVFWRKLLQLSIKQQKHILEIIVETSLCLIKQEQFEKLHKLLLPVELHPLKQVILLLGWTYCKTHSVARRLLDVLWDKKLVSLHPVLNAGCRKLAYQIDLIQWCLEKARPLLRSTVSSPLNERATNLLHGLGTHSVLFVLHQSTSLATLNPSEVVDLLKNYVRQIDGSEKKKKNVRFIIDGREKDGGGITKSGDENQPISNEQERDIAIYRGYCCIKNIMDILQFCYEYSNLDLMNPFCIRRSLHFRNFSRLFSSELSISSSEGDESSGQNTTTMFSQEKTDIIHCQSSFDKLFQEHVTMKLKYTKDHLKKLHPLRYRVEIMENLFSLLFVMHEDMQDSSIIAELDSGEEGAQSESKRSSQDPISEEDISPVICDSSFFMSGSSSQDQNLSGPLNTNYDEPFEERPPVNQTMYVKPNSISSDQVFHDNSDLGQEVTNLTNNLTKQPRLEKSSNSAPTEKSFISKFGFLANEYVVRDVLAMLKDSLVDLAAARYELMGQKNEMLQKTNESVLQVDAALEKSLGQLVKSSVTEETLQTRLTRLTQYVHEAQWRFQLVSHDQLPRQPGTVLVQPVFVVNDDITSVCLSDSFYSNKKISVSDKSSVPKNNRNSLGPDRLSPVADDGEKPRRCSQTKSRSESHCLSPFIHDTGIIPLMLSSPDTLLVMSLTKENYAQASQVIKLFKLQNQVEALEVGFSEDFKKAASKLQSHGRELISRHTLPGQLNIKTLGRVAAVGVASASLSDVTEDLLSHPDIPELAFPKGLASAPEQIRSLFKEAGSSSAILLDLVCTSCRTWDLCTKLFDIMKIKTKSSSGSESGHGLVSAHQEKKSKTDAKIKGFKVFKQQMENLIYSGLDEDNFQSTEIQAPDSFPKHSLEYHLTKATCSLTADENISFYRAWKEMKENMEKVMGAFKKINQTEKTDSQHLSPPSPTSSPRSSSNNQKLSKMTQNKNSPLIHTAFKQLISVLEKQVPPGGIINLLKKSAIDMHDRNYLQSLYDHVKLLAFLVAESECKSKETMVVPQNYFKILEEGPIAILGHLMFVKKMIPVRLESIAQTLSLNLMHIIVHSCCPRIPSKHLPPIQLQSEFEWFGTKIIYNSGQQTTKGNNVEILVQTILIRLLKFMKGIAAKSNARGIFDITCAKFAIEQSEYAEIISLTRELQNSDLTSLKSRETTLCFLVNLQNIMTIHQNLNIVWLKKQSQNLSELESSRVKIVREVQELCPVSGIDNIVQLKQFAYRVGQLGVVSLFDLKIIINRHCLPMPSRWKNILHDSDSYVDCNDYWSKCSSYCEPRLLFALTDGSLSSPPVQVLTPELLDVQLQKATKSFLQHTVVVDRKGKRVTIPALLYWYREDFSDKGDNQNEIKLEGLLTFVAQNLSEVKASDLNQLLNFDEEPENLDMSGARELPFTVKLIPHSTEFGFIFDTNMMVTGVQVHRQISSLPNSLECSTESIVQSYESGFVVEKSAYRLTPTTLDYVKNDSSLVATLVSLVCADELDDLEIPMEDYFLSESAKSCSTSMSDISIVDTRSYRYQRLTNEFPILERHLLNYVVPLAAVDKPEIIAGSEPILKFVTNEIDDKVKVCMLSLHDSIQFEEVISDMIKQTSAKSNWAALLRLFHCIPELTMNEKQNWQIVHDFVLGCWATRQIKSNPDSSQIPDELKKFYCHDNQARTVLAVCDLIPEYHGIDVIEACLMHSLSGNLHDTLKIKLEKMKIYSQITDSVKNLQFRLSTSEFVNTEEMDINRMYAVKLKYFTDWRIVVKVTESSPKEVLDILIRSRDFEIAKKWAKMHALSNEIKLEIDEQYILSLLESKNPNTAKAFQVLEDLKGNNSTACLSMCEMLLQKLTDYKDVQFIASYILNSFRTELSDDVAESHILRLIGAKALLCLPFSIRGEYSNLVTTPHLILEQLLMNMKVDLAGQVFLKINGDFSQIQTQSLKCTTEQFNELLIEYATKAVEVTVVQVIESDKERSQSLCSGGSAKNEEGEMTTSTTRYFNESVRVRRMGFDGTVSPKTVIGSPLGSSPGMNKRIVSPVSSQGKFMMPVQPPPKEKWVPDSATAVCMVCKVERFSMFNRRHHCRQCGRVVCAACSTKRTVIGGESARICDDCYNQIYNPSDMKSREGEFYSQRRKESISVASTSVHGDSPSRVNSPELHIEGQGVDILYDDGIWQLSTDVNHNIAVREEFYYEQAPSVSLCMSILHLHSDQQQCGQQMLRMCDYLSEFLQPVSPGVPNPEVDYALIISMMLQLLFQAKLKFLKCGDNQGLGMCDMYQIRVDLLKILVAANYKDLPSIQQLTKVDTVRRLRDKLIENERLSLAMEVSTKCGLDPAGVWASWGMACFLRGDYTGAREKFSHCLKVPKDCNQSATSHLLSEIVDYLEHMPSSGMTEIQMFQTNQGSLKNIVNFPTANNTDRIGIDTTPFQECLFYLRSYGTYRDHLGFLQRNGYWMKAAKFILDHKCSSEVFIESLLEPALLSGELSKLLDQMLMLDTSLEKWNIYLTATCRYLVKQHLFNSLYQVQLFMKDFIRAAMTCISHFYQHRAQSYRDLAGRIHYLFTAQQHMQSYLDPSKWGSVHHPTSSPMVKKGPDWGQTSTAESAVRTILTPEEVAKYMHTIALQIEVTNFLDQCLANMEGEATALAASCTAESQTSDLPSLFGSTKVKTDLVCMILLSGNDIKVSFDLSYRIIKECHLRATSILSHTAREMAKHQRYGLIKQLLDCVSKTNVGTEDMNDEIIGASLLAIVDKDSEAKEAENLIKLLKKDSNKINAYILCGKLRSAYLLAVKGERTEDVERIAGAAQRMEQSAVWNICKKWLQQKK